MVPIVIGILTGASCLAVKGDDIGEICDRGQSFGIVHAACLIVCILDSVGSTI